MLNSSFGQYDISAVGFSDWGYVNANVKFMNTSKVEVKAISDRTIGNETYATASFLIIGGLETITAYSNDLEEVQDSYSPSGPEHFGPYIEYQLISYGTGLAQLSIYGD